MPDQGAALILRDNPSEKRQTFEFNLKAANVNTNFFYEFLIRNGNIYWHQLI